MRRLAPACSGVRKATGTFYTPLPIADYLVRRTLGPLVRQASPDHILSLRILDPAMGSGAFLVAACRYLATAYETALLRSGGCHASDIGEQERALVRRTIAERCLYGVDVNPMAVQVARLSLWLATLAADRPLTFLYHHLQAGDSLLGTWLATLARIPGRRPASSRRDSSTLPMFALEPVRGALPAVHRCPSGSRSSPFPTTLSRTFARRSRPSRAQPARQRLSRWKTRRGSGVLTGSPISANGCPLPRSAPCLAPSCQVQALFHRRSLIAFQRADEVARARHLFTGSSEFPEAFGSDGRRLEERRLSRGDRQPPWDMMRHDAGSAESRKHARPEIAPVLRFAHDSGIYTAQSKGHANRYQLFTERALALARHGGRVGLVLPAGLATDHGSAGLRRRLLSDCDVDALVSFDNQRGVFPIHRSVRFHLITATRGSPTRVIAYRPAERDPAALETTGDDPPAASAWFPVRITPGLIHRLSGDSLAIPNFRSETDVVVAERAASLFPPAGDQRGWSARFGRELNATEDRAAFGRPGSGLPVIEGKHVEPFRVHVDRARASMRGPRAAVTTLAVRGRGACQDVAGAANRLTPLRSFRRSAFSTHTVFLRPVPLAAQWGLYGLFNSFVVNYLVRMRVTTHVTTSTVERLPLPRQADSPRAFREIAAIARLLSRRDDAAAAARLQATVAGLYRLSASELAHVLSTFPLVPEDDEFT